MAQDMAPVREAGRSASTPALTILVCFLIAALEGYDIQAFGVAAPKLVRELGLTAGEQGWAASAAMIGLVIGAFMGGWLADRVGRKPVLLVSTAGFGLMSVATALSHNYDLLLLARLATGLGFGGALPNLIAVGTEISAPSRRAATVTMMFCGMPAGGTAVALLTRAAGEGLDWRTVFMIGGILPLLLTPFTYFALPETRPQHDPAADRGALRALFGGGRAPGTLLLWLVYFLTLLVLYLMLNWLPTLVIAKGFTPAEGSAASMWFNLLAIPGALLFGFIVDRAGYVWPLALCYLLLAAAMYALSSTTAVDPMLVLSGVAGFLVLGAQYSLYAVAPMLYAPEVRAFGAGAAVAMGRLGSVAGPLLAGQLRQAGYSADGVFGAMIPVVLVGGITMVGLRLFAKPHRDA